MDFIDFACDYSQMVSVTCIIRTVYVCMVAKPAKFVSYLYCAVCFDFVLVTVFDNQCVSTVQNFSQQI